MAASGVQVRSIDMKVATSAATAIHGTAARTARALEMPITAHRTAPAKSRTSGMISANLGPRFGADASMAGAMEVEAMEVRTNSAWSMGFTRRLPCWERWPGRW